MRRPALLLSPLCILAAAPALAQQTSPADLAAQPQAEAATGTAAGQDHAHDQPDFHQPEAPDIVVTGFRRNRTDILAGTSVLSDQALERNTRSSIGETLASQPGVSASSFGPSASRPILRGFQGDRVRILTDGIGSLDASSASADHAVAINTLTADRIEVLRGPVALLFGSSAIGGVVNVIDSRIPRRLPEEAVHAEGTATYGSAADERAVAGAIDIPLGGDFVAHADASYSRSDDLRIGGYVLSPTLRAQALASPDPAIRDLASLRGRLPNTAAETSDIALGAAWVHNDTNIGFSVNQYDSLYGVPIRYSLDPTIEAEAPRIDVHQRRADARAEIAMGAGFLESVRLRAGYSDYRHDELEADGAIGTTFLSEGYEGRLEFVQRRSNGFGGGFGVQFLNVDASVIGDEKFLPPNHTRQIGLFALETLERGAFRAELGGRYEHQDVTATADATIGNSDISRSFDTVSASAGASYGLARGIRIGVNLSRAQRAPSAEELFANGPHAGTQAFEIGDPTLRPETSWSVEGTFRYDGDYSRVAVSVFQTWFDNYIYDAITGAVRDGLPVFQTAQGNARYTGFEVEGSTRLAEVGHFHLNVDALADYVAATIDTVGPAPRIPPLRMLGGVELQSEPLTGRVEVEHVFDQDRAAPNETATEGFTLVNASINWRPLPIHPEISLTLSANNIFDVDARRAASVLKDYAPLGGRDLRATLRVSF